MLAAGHDTGVHPAREKYIVCENGLRKLPYCSILDVIIKRGYINTPNEVRSVTGWRVKGTSILSLIPRLHVWPGNEAMVSLVPRPRGRRVRVRCLGTRLGYGILNYLHVPSIP